MEFLLNNYIWFIIGFIVILMIVIGYLAEKTQFGSKKIKKKEKIVRKKKEDEVLEQVEHAKNTRINEAILENAELLKKDQMTSSSRVEPLSSVERSSIERPSVERKVKEESIPEELTVPFGNIEPTKEETIVENVTLEDPLEVPTLKRKEEAVMEESFEDMYSPLGNEDAQVSTYEEVEPVEKVQIPLPNIQDLRKEKTDDDDVWNF